MEAFFSTQKINRKSFKELTVRRKHDFFHPLIPYLLSTSFWHTNSVLLESIMWKLHMDQAYKRLLAVAFRQQLKLNAD